MLLIRDKNDPRNKTGNDQRIRLFVTTGLDDWARLSRRVVASDYQSRGQSMAGSLRRHHTDVGFLPYGCRW